MKKTTLSIVVALCVCGCIFYRSFAYKPLAPPLDAPQYHGWQLVAQSDVIVSGILDVPVESIRRSIESQESKYKDVSITDAVFIKGTTFGKNVEFQVYSKSSIYNNLNYLIEKEGEEVTSFLVFSDADAQKKLFLLGSIENSVIVKNKKEEESIKKEIENQRNIVKNFTNSPLSKPDESHEKVSSLIEKMLNSSTEAKAFQELESLGMNAVPSVIRLMDDRRSLPNRRIVLRNKSKNSFEENRQYSPELVVDALSSILTQIVGQSFGSIQNGGSEEERTKTINAWRVYLFYHMNQEEN